VSNYYEQATAEFTSEYVIEVTEESGNDLLVKTFTTVPYFSIRGYNTLPVPYVSVRQFDDDLNKKAD
jgi:hypothetical protein